MVDGWLMLILLKRCTYVYSPAWTAKQGRKQERKKERKEERKKVMHVNSLHSCVGRCSFVDVDVDISAFVLIGMLVCLQRGDVNSFHSCVGRCSFVNVDISAFFFFFFFFFFFACWFVSKSRCACQPKCVVYTRS